MPRAPNNSFCGSCGKVIKPGQQISLEGLCYECKRRLTRRIGDANKEIGKLRKP